MASLLDFLAPGNGSGLLGNMQPTPAPMPSPAPSFGNLLSDNALTLMALGAGIAQGGIGRGLQMAVPAAQYEQQQRQQQQARMAGYNAGLQPDSPQAQALSLAWNPDAFKALQQKRQFELSQALEREKMAKPVVVPYGAELQAPMTGQPVNPQGAGGTLTDQAKTIAQGIVSGNQPPKTEGLYRVGPAVRSELEKSGFNLADAQMQWQRAQKQILALNGPQMTRFVGLADSVDRTIDEVRDLSKQMDLSGIPKLNHLQLQAYIQTAGNTPNGQLATRYVGAVNTLKEEFANLANGGYAPTEPAWKLANEQINGTYGSKQLSASLDEVQRLIRYRKQAIPNIDTLGPGAGNRYVPSGGQPSAGHGAAPPSPSATEAAPSGLIVPPPAAIKALRSNPSLLRQFEEKYGKGSAAKYLNET